MVIDDVDIDDVINRIIIGWRRRAKWYWFFTSKYKIGQEFSWEREWEWGNTQVTSDSNSKVKING